MDHELLVAVFKRIASLSVGFKEYYCRCFRTTSEYYTSLDHNYSLQIGYPDTTMKQRQRNNRHVHNHQHNRITLRHTRVHDSWRNKNSNTWWWASRHAVRTDTWWQAIDKSCSIEGSAVTLIIQRWDCNHRLNFSERQRNNSTCSTATQSTKCLCLHDMGWLPVSPYIR